MLHSKRFWAAVILLLIMLCCIVGMEILQHSRDAAETDSALPPLVWQTTYAEQETVLTTQTDIITGTTAVTETVTVTETEPLPEPSAMDPVLPDWKLDELQARVQQLSAELSNFVGWLYAADSLIDYPVVQGSDNQFYLSHAPNDSYLEIGSIFLDCRCDRALHDRTNILYGHNMSEGMFGDIRSFRTQEQFDAHPYGWLITLDTVYRLDFFVLSVTDAYDMLYDVPADCEAWTARLYETAEFSREIALAEDDRLIALSTCTPAQMEQARALLTGRLSVQGEDF